MRAGPAGLSAISNLRGTDQSISSNERNVKYFEFVRAHCAVVQALGTVVMGRDKFSSYSIPGTERKEFISS